MYQFGEFIFDDSQQTLLAVDSKQALSIEPKLLELLCLFIKKPNATISREEILECIWADSLVTDNAVNKMVGNLRKVLGDNAKSPRYIQTVPKRGYRFICPVTLLEHARPQELTTDLLIEAAPEHSHEHKQETENKVSEALESTVIQAPNVTKESSQTQQYSSSNSLQRIAFASFIVLFFLYALSNVLKEEPSQQEGHSLALTRGQGVEFSPVMHPDNEHLFYLKKDNDNQRPSLWLKNINTAATQRVNLNLNLKSDIESDINRKMLTAPKEIVAVSMQGDDAQLILHEESGDICVMHRAIVRMPSTSNEAPVVTDVEPLFDCRDKRIKDVDYHPQQVALYYTAQPENFWPNHIYVFDIKSKQHRLIEQVAPEGWGYHSIDISPDGEKLLIMSTKNDHKTQLLALNLSTHELVDGIQFNRPVYHAIWHHDSEQVLYYAEPPAQQILKSKLNGDDATVLISVTDQLSAKMSRMFDKQNLLFSTQTENYDNRWLMPSNSSSAIPNSTVFDGHPALFHHRNQYLFTSQRSGITQLFIGSFANEHVKIVTSFTESYSIGDISISPNDEHVLLSIEEKVYLLPTSELSGEHLMANIDADSLVYLSESPIIALDWLGAEKAAITVVKNGKPTLEVVELSEDRTQSSWSKWAYGLTDATKPDHWYVIEQHSNRLYHSQNGEATPLSREYSDAADNLFDTHITLPKSFYLARIDNGTLYFVTSLKGQEYLHSIPLNGDERGRSVPLNSVYRFDASREKLLINDVTNRDGDIYRTVF